MAKLSYVHVAVGSLSAKKQAVFTYSTSETYKKGQVVSVKLRKEKVLGIIIRTVPEPEFKTSPVNEVFPYFLPEPLLTTLLWALDHYPFEKGSVVKLFTPPDFPTRRTKNAAPLQSRLTNRKLPNPTKDQMNAIKEIESSDHTVILHGKTGTGKTHIYVHLIRELLQEGKSILLLVPEISLGEQLKSVVEAYVAPVFTYNSLQTKAQRRDMWYAIAQSDTPRVIIGPRSALFLPMKNLGMIIMDEAHDMSYKQQQSPYYTTLHMAASLAHSSDLKLIYGSATPNVTDYAIARSRNHPIAELHERPIALGTGSSTDFHIINNRERHLFTRNQVLANEAINQIADSVKHGKQSLLLLNRRGTAHLIQCEACGWQYRCSICDHTLVYHKDTHKAVCHYCDKKYPMLSVCPEDSEPLKLLTIGTKFIEEECRKLFPHATIARLDTDSVNRKNIQETMQSIRNGQASIIVGTQLVAKGLDLPLLETIVIVDASRQSSDYLGDEHYYQLIHQVIGRGMRGHQQAKIYLQTPEPSDPLIEWATHDDWQSFYEHELHERKTFNYPPFNYLATFRLERVKKERVEILVESFKENLRAKRLPIQILGPMPTYQASGKNVWLVVAKAKKRSHLIQAADLLKGGWSVDLDAVST